jgi:hypothetical protein
MTEIQSLESPAYALSLDLNFIVFYLILNGCWMLFNDFCDFEKVNQK